MLTIIILVTLLICVIGFYLFMIKNDELLKLVNEKDYIIYELNKELREELERKGGR